MRRPFGGGRGARYVNSVHMMLLWWDSDVRRIAPGCLRYLHPISRNAIETEVESYSRATLFLSAFH